METNKDNSDSSGSKIIKENKIKRTKSKNNGNNINNENQTKRTFLSNFGSRRKKKESSITDGPTNNDQNIQRNNVTESDASILNPPTYETREDDLNNVLAITEPHAEEYFMKHPRRGKAVIFSHETFEREDPRDGTKADVERIQKIFGNVLKFEIEIHIDLEFVAILDEIKKLSTDNYTNCDCIAIFILTHGKKGGLLAAKDVYYPAEKIWEPFAGDKCKTLAGKPKLFFISACRGQKKDTGIRFFRSGRTQTDSSNKPMSYKLPNQADFLVANSTVEGYYSYRDIHNGTWFVHCLCDVISEYYTSKDLLKMLTITSRKIAVDFRAPESSDLTQIPSITSMLIRDVYFHTSE